MRYLIVFFVFSSVPVMALADEAPDTIVVTANRTPQPLARVGQAVSVLDEAELTRRQTATVSDLLRTLPGVTVARNGGPGGPASAFIRGADSAQTVALIDGVKLNDPASPAGGFNFGNLLLGNIERIEVLRGAQSVLWGSQAIGGVVNMLTRAPTDDLQVNVRGEYGWRDTGQIVGNVAGRAGPVSASVGAGWFRTDGISAFSEARGGAEPDGYENIGANANFNLALSDAISVDARGWFSDGKNGQDGFAPPTFAFGDTAESTRTREVVGYTGLNVALLDGRFRNRLGFALTDTRRRSDDSGFETFAADGRNERLEYQGVLDIAEGWQATAGLERETSRYNTLGFGAASMGRAQIDSVYGQLVAAPMAGLTLTGGLRHDEHNRFGGATTLGGSGVWTLASGTMLRASYAEGFKAPSLFQLQSDFGNQALRPERAKSWDVGLTQALGAVQGEVSATYFKRVSSDLIDFVSCPAQVGICVNRRFGTFDNVQNARAQGLELSMLLRPVEAVRVQANYSWTEATNQSAGSANFGKRLARRPEHSISALVDVEWTERLSMGATLTHVGASFEDAANRTRLQGYVLADVRVSYRIFDSISLYGRIENLFDENYETALRFGQPGRAGFVGVRAVY